MANDPPLATLNHVAGDLGIPSESALLRIGIRRNRGRGRPHHRDRSQAKILRTGLWGSTVGPLVRRLGGEVWPQDSQLMTARLPAAYAAHRKRPVGGRNPPLAPPPRLPSEHSPCAGCAAGSVERHLRRFLHTDLHAIRPSLPLRSLEDPALMGNCRSGSIVPLLFIHFVTGALIAAVPIGLTPRNAAVLFRNHPSDFLLIQVCASSADAKPPMCCSRPYCHKTRTYHPGADFS